MKIQNHIQEIKPEKSRTMQDQGAGSRPGAGKEARRVKEGKQGKLGFKVVDFRKFIGYKIRCPRSSPIGSGHMGLNGQPGLKEQIVKGMTQMKINDRIILVFLSPPPTTSTSFLF